MHCVNLTGWGGGGVREMLNKIHLALFSVIMTSGACAHGFHAISRQIIVQSLSLYILRLIILIPKMVFPQQPLVPTPPQPPHFWVSMFNSGIVSGYVFDFVQHTGFDCATSAQNAGDTCHFEQHVMFWCHCPSD